MRYHFSCAVINLPKIAAQNIIVNRKLSLMTSSRNQQSMIAPSARLARLLDFVAADPQNVNLLSDAAHLAFDENNFEVCASLIQQCEGKGLPDALMNLGGLLAMVQSQFETAISCFEKLIKDDADSDPVVLHNIAYAQAMLGHYDVAVETLSEKVLATVPTAIVLKMRVLQHLTRQEEAIALGRQCANHPVAASDVRGALAIALLDDGDKEGARAAAAACPHSTDGLAVLGLIELDDVKLEDAHSKFDQAIVLNQRNGRAHLGQGLAYFSEHQFDPAIVHLDQGAHLLVSYPNAWVAAGWAYLLTQQFGIARQRFEQAIAVDRGFAEAHGALAVLNVYEKNFAEAERLADVAARLNSECLAAALAKNLLLRRDAQPAEIQSLQLAWLQTPMNIDGMTIGQAMSKRAVLKK